MQRSLTLILLLAISAVTQAAAHVATSQQPAGNAAAAAADEVFRQMLYMPAPTPRTARAEESGGARDRKHPSHFYDEDKPPPDDAADADIVDYWERWADSAGHSGHTPSNAVSSRLLAACESEPESLPRLLALMPDEPETAERVKKLYDESQSSATLGDEWRKQVREWLRFNSQYFLDELLSDARKAADKDGYVDKEEALKALAKVDWASAEPLLRSLSEGGQQRTAAFALSLLHRHAAAVKDSAAEENFRARLQAIATDRSTRARARDTAIEELSLTDWPGRDDWYLSLFADETLLEPKDGFYLFSPLTTLFDRDPDKWIPVMAKLVESKDSSVRQNAASCLVQYTTGRTVRRDAVLPVLRWLSDPGWLHINGTEYAWFLQKMDEADLPESVLGLIWIVEHDEWNGHWAARTLAHFKDPRAVPALRKALAQEKGENYRLDILNGLVASGGLSEAEQLAGLEAYAAKIATPEGRADVERYRAQDDAPLPVPVSIGNYLARQKEAPDSLVRAAFARAEVLRKQNPAQARALLGVVEGWQARQVDLDIVRRIGSGKADAATIANALERREKLRENVPQELQTIAARGGAPQGVAAILLADDTLAQSVLASEDEPARVALLACARLTQTPLPVTQVGALLRDKSADLRLAAEHYLLAEDSAQARALLLEHHPGEAFITGWRENVPLIGGNDFSAMGRAEEKLRAELFSKEDAPQQVFALLGNDERPLHALRVYKDRAVYTHYEDSARYRERAVTAAELARFKQFVTSSNLLDLGPQIGSCHYNCSLSEFLFLERDGGRRVFSHQAFDVWLTVILNFESLDEGAKVHYRLADELKGLEVLVADDSLSIRDVWQKGDDVRVLVERAETPEEITQGRSESSKDEEEEEDSNAARTKRRRVEWEKATARLSWHVFSGGRLGAVTTKPEGRATYDDELLDVDDEKFPSHVNAHLAQAKADGCYVLAGELSRGGLWKKCPGREPARVSNGEGIYADPLVTSDGIWAVAAKTDTDWGKPNEVVRFNLRTGREYRVAIPPADQFEPVAYIAAHGEVLLRRARDDDDERKETGGPAAPEYYLLDSTTGRTRLVTGIFAPLLQEGDRPLQPTGNADEFWAALPDRARDETRVGRYNTKDFSFRTLLVLPHIRFDSFQMWADEAGAKIYVTYQGQLLRLPLPTTK